MGRKSPDAINNAVGHKRSALCRLVFSIYAVILFLNECDWLVDLTQRVIVLRGNISFLVYAHIFFIVAQLFTLGAI